MRRNGMPLALLAVLAVTAGALQAQSPARRFGHRTAGARSLGPPARPAVLADAAGARNAADMRQASRQSPLYRPWYAAPYGYRADYYRPWYAAPYRYYADYYRPWYTIPYAYRPGYGYGYALYGPRYYSLRGLYCSGYFGGHSPGYGYCAPPADYGCPAAVSPPWDYGGCYYW